MRNSTDIVAACGLRFLQERLWFRSRNDRLRLRARERDAETTDSVAPVGAARSLRAVLVEREVGVRRAARQVAVTAAQAQLNRSV